MKARSLKKQYTDLLKDVDIANGRKETISLLRKAERIRKKIYKTTKYDCFKCKGLGYQRISQDVAKTCLSCYGKGYVIRNIIKTN